MSSGAKDKIFEIAKKMAQEDAEKSGIGGWEDIRDLTHLKLMTDGEVYLLAAVIEYLETAPKSNVDTEAKEAPKDKLNKEDIDVRNGKIGIFKGFIN